MTFLSHIHSRGQCSRDRQEPDEPIFYQKHGTPQKNIYFNNYRLSRAGRVVENAFGILHVAHKFKVILWTMNQRPETWRKNHHSLCDPSKSHQTEISSDPQQPDGLEGF